jgi:hypothetical protein
MQAGVIGGAADGPEPRAAGDHRARAHGDRRQRHMRHPPAAAAHGDEAAARADATGNDHPAAARRADRRTGSRSEIRAAMLPCGEGIRLDLEAGGDASADRVDEHEREDRGDGHARTVRLGWRVSAGCA